MSRQPFGTLRWTKGKTLIAYALTRSDTEIFFHRIKRSGLGGEGHLMHLDDWEGCLYTLGGNWSFVPADDDFEGNV